MISQKRKHFQSSGRKFLWLLLVVLLIFKSSAATAQNLGTDAEREAGKLLYDKYCVQCHGEKGDGVSESSLYYRPAPRDFTRGKYKVRTTESGELPTDEDILKAIRDGVAFKSGGAFTVMPPWPNLSDRQLMNLVYYLKSFAPDFADPEYNKPKVVEIPKAPAFSEESAKIGRKVYEANECIRCHGSYGRGDGPSAPTLTDDLGFPIRAADLTKRWTFRGGHTKEDIFRTISTGFNGTPMPAYLESVTVEDRWHLVNYLNTLSDRDTPGFNLPDSPVLVRAIESDIDLADFETAKKLFSEAEPAYVPIIGQVIEPGRSFFPATNEVIVRAIYNESDVALMLTWNDIRKDVSGSNSPTMKAPLFDPEDYRPKSKATTDGDDPFADFAEADPFADEEEAQQPAESMYSDAVAVQIPVSLSDGFRKPYFLGGDSREAVEIWFSDLAKSKGEVLQGRGINAIEKVDSKSVEMISSFYEGEWTAIFKRSRQLDGGIEFLESQFIPVVFYVWDGTAEERGAKAGITSWYALYMEPSEKPSALAPMLIYGLGLLILEILIIVLVRRRYSSGK